jgi:hypothetical protein
MLFDAGKDGGEVYGNSWFMTMPAREPGKEVLALLACNLERGTHNISARYCFLDRIKGRINDLDHFTRIDVHGYCSSDTTQVVEISIVFDDGTTYGKLVTMEPGREKYSMELSELERIQPINLPNSFPTFLPFYSIGKFEKTFNLQDAESIQFSIGPGIPEEELANPQGVYIEKVILK